MCVQKFSLFIFYEHAIKMNKTTMRELYEIKSIKVTY
jgi:hypothetical protein